MLPFDNSPTRMTTEFRPKAFEDRFSRFFDLQKRRIAVGADEQSDGAERANTSDPDGLEGEVLHTDCGRGWWRL
jgi:hypothetical protein